MISETGCVNILLFVWCTTDNLHLFSQIQKCLLSHLVKQILGVSRCRLAIIQTYHTYTGTDLAFWGQKTCIILHISTDMEILIHYLRVLKIQISWACWSPIWVIMTGSPDLLLLLSVSSHYRNHPRFLKHFWPDGSLQNNWRPRWDSVKFSK